MRLETSGEYAVFGSQNPIGKHAVARLKPRPENHP
jgi:hypothetical protein